MLLTLGLDSQFALMETVTTAILDAFPALRNYKLWVVLAAAVLGYAGGIIFTTNVSSPKKNTFFHRETRIDTLNIHIAKIDYKDNIRNLWLFLTIRDNCLIIISIIIIN